MEEKTAKMGFPDKLKAFFKNDIVKTVIVLALIATVSGILLGTVNHFTQVDENALMQQSLNEFYASEAGYSDLLQTGSTVIGNTYENASIIKAYEASDGAYLLLAHGDESYNSKGIELWIAIKDGVIEKLAEYSTSETPGLGSKATKNAHFSQYVGVNIFDVESFVWVKKGNDASADDVIMAVSGASKSTRAVNYAVNAAVEFYKSRTGGQA